MRLVISVTVTFGLAVLLAPATMAAAKKAKSSAQPACLNALACGPQPVPKIRKPRSEKFLKAAS
jgi:hypothetical protein